MGFRLSAYARPVCSPSLEKLRDVRENELAPSPIFGQRGSAMSYDVATFCSLSTLFRTVGRCIIRSCHAV